MRFSFWTENGFAYIKAELVESHGDSSKGPRFQGPFDELEMVGDTVFYSYIPKNLHPDTLAMACWHLFFPWIGKSVEFPMPVSPRIEEMVNFPTYSQFKGEVKVLNTDQNVLPYARKEVGNLRPSDVAICFGGGIDSSALHVMYPESLLIHEVPITDPKEDYSFRGAVKSMIELEKRFGTPYQVVATNSREISNPRGVSSWLAPMVPAVMIAADRKKHSLLLGTNLGTLFLQNGKKYLPAHNIVNLARDSLAEVSVDIIQASGGVSQYQATKLCVDAGISGLLNFCELGENAGPCGKCLKCMRREYLFRLVAKESGMTDLSDFPVNTEIGIEKYNIERAMKIFAPGSHEPYTHVFAFMRDNLGDDFPLELMPLCSKAPPAEFMRFWPEEADEIFPANHIELLDRAKKMIPSMSDIPDIIFKNWDAMPKKDD